MNMDLAKLLDTLPDDALVLVPVRWLRSRLQQPAVQADGVADLSCADVAKLLHRTPGCIRGWCQRGELNAYRLNGRDWRIKPSSLRAYLDVQAKSDRVAGNGPVNLGSWRQK